MKHIVVISVCDEDGYDVPVVAADTLELAQAKLVEWQQKNAGNTHWTEITQETWLELHIAGEIPGRVLEDSPIPGYR